MKTSKDTIDRFLETKSMAFAGLSRNPKKFGNEIYKELANKGFKLYPINPNTTEIEGDKCYTSVNELPEEADRQVCRAHPG